MSTVIDGVLMEMAAPNERHGDAGVHGFDS
jgi:hypothetical protein